MSFIISGLNGNSFQHLYGLSDDELKAYGAIRFNVDKYPSCPDRITLTDIPVGKHAILLNHTYLDSRSPYRGTHAIFIWEGKIEPQVLKDEIPEIMQNRMISLRAFDQNDMMIEAGVVSSEDIKETILAFFQISEVEFIHAHNAKQGCFSCRITRG